MNSLEKYLSKNSEIKKLRSEWNVLLKEERRIQKHRLTVQKKLNETIDKGVKACISNLSLEEISYIYIFGMENTTRYRELNKRLEKYPWITSHGYYPSTLQTSFKISIAPKDSLEKLTEIANILENVFFSMLKPVRKNEKIIGIFEDSLSEFGIYDLILDNGVYSVRLTRYSRESTEYVAKDLLDALKYIQKAHPYTPYEERKKIRQEADDQDDDY